MCLTLVIYQESSALFQIHHLFHHLNIRHNLHWPGDSALESTTNTCKVVPVHALKAYGGRRGIAPLILNLGTRWRWVVSFTPLPICRPPWKETCFPTSRKLSVPQNRSGSFVEQKSLTFARVRTFDLPARNLVTILKTVSWLPKGTTNK